MVMHEKAMELSRLIGSNIEKHRQRIEFYKRKLKAVTVEEDEEGIEMAITEQEAVMANWQKADELLQQIQ